MTLTERLHAGSGFTEAEQGIARYLLDNPDALEQAPIGAVARATHTSNATVVRLCKKLGFVGIRELRHALVRELEAEKFAARSVDSTVPFTTRESTPRWWRACTRCTKRRSRWCKRS